MVKSALSANRAMATLDWIVSHPGEQFTLSELSRALGINIPSLMSVLQSLTDSGYLSRHASRKTYEAGPALLAIGLSIGSHNRSFEILNSELEQLARDAETECTASVAIGDRTMTVGEAGRPSTHSLPSRVGSRFPLIAPLGHMHVAWSSRAEIEAWMDLAEQEEIAPQRERIEQELKKVRQSGYAIFHYQHAGWQPSNALEQALSAPNDPTRFDAVRRAMAEFTRGWEMIEPRAGEIYEVSNASAPVFNAHGKPIMVVSLNGYRRIEGEQLRSHIERLLQTTRMLTKYGNGRYPDAE